VRLDVDVRAVLDVLHEVVVRVVVVAVELPQHAGFGDEQGDQRPARLHREAVRRLALIIDEHK